ncbi:hypothetical protein ACFLZB_02800 [Nanoarchaeota archaeon]
MKIIEKIKYAVAPLVAAAYFTFAPMNVANAQDVNVKPKSEPTPAAKKVTPASLDVALENFSFVDSAGSDSHTQRIEVGDDLFRADHTITDGGYEGWRVGGRHKVSLADVVSGKLGMFGTVDNAGSYGLGAEFNGTIADVIQAGFSLERNTGSDSRLFQIYAGTNPTENSNVKISYFLKDGVSHLQGTGWLDLEGPRIMAALGGQVSEEGKGKVNACVSHYGPKKGEGVGFRLWGQTDFDGNYVVDATVTIGDRLGSGAVKGLMTLADNGINDPSVVSNIADFRLAPLYCYGQKAIARVRATHKKDGTVAYSGEAYVRSDELFGKDVNVSAGGGFTRVEMPGQVAEHIYNITVGADAGPITLEGSADFGQGRKPTWTAYVASSLNRIVDYFRKDDKKK